jgi:hypothetical protein
VITRLLFKKYVNRADLSTSTSTESFEMKNSANRLPSKQEMTPPGKQLYNDNQTEFSASSGVSMTTGLVPKDKRNVMFTPTIRSPY